MAWTETIHCDVCGRAKNEDQHDWWLASVETISPTPNAEQPVMKLTPWNDFLAHSAEVRHLCGARCSQTALDRWMAPIHDKLRLGEAALVEEEDDVPAPGA